MHGTLHGTLSGTLSGTLRRTFAWDVAQDAARNNFSIRPLPAAMTYNSLAPMPLLAAAIVCIITLGFAASCKPIADPSGPSGSVTPAFTQNDTAGVPVSLSDFRGSIVVVEFWASWCGPCRAQRPWVRDFVARTRDSGVAMIGVSLDYDLDAWRSYVRENSLHWTQLSDGRYWDNAVARQFGISATPTFIIFDREGQRVGERMSFTQMEKRIGELLAAEG